MKAELKQYQREPEPFWQALQLQGVAGYDAIDLAEQRGWEAIADWGQQGWNLGAWPYIIIFFRDREGRYEVLEYVEGDVTVYSCPTREIRTAITDELAFFHWNIRGEPWVKGYESVAQLPDALRGPYRVA